MFESYASPNSQRWGRNRPVWRRRARGGLKPLQRADGLETRELGGVRRSPPRAVSDVSDPAHHNDHRLVSEPALGCPRLPNRLVFVTGVATLFPSNQTTPGG